MANSMRYKANFSSSLLVTTLLLLLIKYSHTKASAQSIYDDHYSSKYDENEQFDYQYDTTSFNKNLLRRLKNNRIIGGVEVKPGQFPYQAFLIDRINTANAIRCGGAIMDERHILTAAQCVTYSQSLIDPFRFNVLVGDLDTSKDGDMHQVFSVEKIFVHPSFTETLLGSDLSVLRINGSMKFVNKQSGYGSIEPVCIPDTPELELGEKVTLSGWNVTEQTGQMTQRLMTLDVPVLSPFTCLFQLPLVPKGTICFGLMDGVRNACERDIGGPLITRRSNCPEIHGVVSFIITNRINDTISCVNPGLTVATSFDHHKKWIFDTIDESNREINGKVPQISSE